MRRSAAAAGAELAGRAACLLAGAFLGAGAAAQDLRAPLSARISLTDAAGAPLGAPKAGEPFGIEVVLTDEATGVPPKGLTLEGWIRPRAATDLPCAQSARAFRATRRLPTGAIDLNGILLAAFNADGSFGIADPRLDLATANMLAAGTLGAVPDLVAADRAGQRILLHLPGENRLRSVTPEGAVGEIGPGVPLGRPSGLLAAGDGSIWIAGTGDDAHGIIGLDPKGDVLWRHRRPSPILGLAEAGLGEIFAWDRASLVFLDAGGGIAAEGAPPGAIRAAAGAALDDGRGGASRVAAFLGEDRVTGHLAFGDALGAPLDIELAAPADRVALAPETGLALFWNEAGAVSFVDPASGRLAGAVSVEGGIGTLAFAGGAAFLMRPDQSGVTVIDLGSVRPGTAPALREVRLGPRGAARAAEGLLVPLAPSPQVLAVNAETYTGFVVDEASSLGDAPPMTALRLRGGRPERVAVIDRSFREAATGRFLNRATIPEGGPHELVLTTGIGGMSTCFPLEVAGQPAASAPAAVLALEVVGEPSLVARSPGTIRLRLRDASGAAIVPSAPTLSVTSLDFGWRTTLDPVARDAGIVSFALEPPVPGLYALSLSDPAMAGTVPAQIVEVAP